MDRLLGFRGALLLLALCGVIAAGPAMLRAEESRGPLLPEEVAKRHGLVRAWWRQIDVDSARDRIESMTFYGDTLYAQTRLGMITALDSETGRVRWVRQAGSSDYVTTPVGANNEFAVVANGMKVYLFAHDDGKTVLEQKTVNVPGGGPVVAGKHVLVPSVGGVIEGYTYGKTKEPTWFYSTGGRAMVQPYVTPDSVAWPTDRGSFYVAALEPLKPRFRVEAQEPIVAQPGYRAPYFYFGSLDGHVYKVHEFKGNIVWRFTAGEPIDEQPMVFDDRLYVSTRTGGLYCVLADAGASVVDMAAPGKAAAPREGCLIWQVPNVVRLLSASKDRLYGLDKLGRLTILRRADGGYLDAVSMPGLDIAVANGSNDRMFMATSSGTIQCLHENGLDKPIDHLPAPSAKSAAKAVAPKGGAERSRPKAAEPKKAAPAGGGAAAGKKAAEPPAAGAVDVFGDPIKKGAADGAAGGAKKSPEADPFGLGDKKVKDDPFGAGAGAGAGAKKKPAEDDPFGK